LVLPIWYRLTQVVLEKRLLNGCVVVVDADGLLCTKLMALKDVQHADASGLLCVLKEAFMRVGLLDYDKRLIGFMSDEANCKFWTILLQQLFFVAAVVYSGLWDFYMADINNFLFVN